MELKYNIDRLFFALLVALLPMLVMGQVGVGTNSPDGSAILDISSNNQGILIPRISDPSTINNPANGLIIYNSSTDQIEINSGTTSSPFWEKVVTDNTQVWQDSSTYIINNQARLNGEVQVFTNDGRLGIGTRSPQGAVDINSTTGALIVPRMLSSEADLIPTINGSIVYISSPGGSTFTSVGFWFYENGDWVKK